MARRFPPSHRKVNGFARAPAGSTRCRIPPTRGGSRCPSEHLSVFEQIRWRGAPETPENGVLGQKPCVLFEKVRVLFKKPGVPFGFPRVLFWNPRLLLQKARA
jgi:hypothetical protein